MDTPKLNQRIESIDILRGIAMVIMALDHVRDYFHITANIDDPLNLATTTPLLYGTRWITHFCAPIFVFLSGTSIFLQSQRKNKSELSIFLIKRGLWLIFAEWIIVAFGWTFNPFYNIIPFQVIWAIGMSMILLGFAVRLPYIWILIIGSIIVCGHNALDFLEASPDYSPNFVMDVLHSGFFKPYEIWDRHYALIVYAFPVWTGVMMLGYCFGRYFTPNFSPAGREKHIFRWGIGLVLFFIVLRFTNIYGDPVDWSVQPSALYTFFSFMSVDKYPASLLYLAITLGLSFILLSKIEHWKNKVAQFFITFGRTAFFYYIVHLYLIHALATIAFFSRGHTMAEAFDTGNFPFLFVKPGEGYGLFVVYLIWALVIALIYPLCKKYDAYKTANKDKWWLSYL